MKKMLWLILALCFLCSFEIASATSIAFTGMGEYSEGFVPVETDEKWGFIDANGSIIIPCDYDRVGSFSEGMATVCQNEKWGVIDTKGNLIVPFEFDYLYSFHDGLCVFEKNDKYGFIDQSGNIVIDAIYDRAYSFSDGYALVVTGYLGTYIDTTGNTIFEGPFMDANPFHEGLALVKTNDGGIINYHYMNVEGEYVITIPYDRYDRIGSFYGGLAQVGVKQGSTYRHGYINQTGELVVPLEYYNSSGEYSEGYAGEQWEGDDGHIETGYIDDKGNIVINFVGQEYESYGPGFRDGYSMIWSKYTWLGIVDNSGNIVFPCEYDGITWGDGLFFLYKKETGDINIIPYEVPNNIDVTDNDITTGKRNAQIRAMEYLETIPLSRNGLIEQLKYESFSQSEAEYGADNCGADWYEQAEKKALLYLEIGAFSKERLIEQLEYDGFTHDEATIATNRVY